MIKQILFISLVLSFKWVHGENLDVKTIPKARLKMLDGEYAHLSDFNNDGPIIINFWTTWWPFCERQLAYLDQLNTSFKNTGLQVLAVNENKPKIVNQVGSYIRKRKYKFNTAIDPLGKLADKLNIKTLPTTILADKNGNIIYRSVGYKDGMENEYLSELIKYLDQENIEYDDFKFEDKSARRKKAILDVEF